MTTVVDGTEPWAMGAQALLDEMPELRVRKWRSSLTGVSSLYAYEIEVPRPRSAKSFGVFAHEVGHQRLHKDNGNMPRWREEVEAWEFALEQFRRFGFRGERKLRAWIVPRIAYAFGKAVRRGADPREIHRTFPNWSRAVQRYEDGWGALENHLRGRR